MTLTDVVHPLVDRRGVSHRWLGAVVLVGVAGASLLGTALVGCMPRHAPAKPGFRRFGASGGEADGEAARQDRLRPAHEAASTTERTRIEQLGGGDGVMRPYTHVLADLGRRLGDTAADAVASADVPAVMLPRAILSGSSHPARPTMDRPWLTAYAAVPESRPAPPPLGEPVNVTTIPRHEARPIRLPRVVVARPGDRISQIMEGLGLPVRAAAEVDGLLSGSTWLIAQALRGGETMVAEEDPGSPSSLPWRISLTVPGSGTRGVARADDGHYRALPAMDGARPGAPEAGSVPVDASGQSLRDALAGIAQANGLDAGLVAEVGRLCGHDVGLDDSVGTGDTVELLFSDNEIGQPELAFMGLTVGRRRFGYYRYVAPDDASTDFYDASGRSVTGFLLRKPVATGRLGDGFGWRTHPVLGDRRFHQGVDYAAPYGSPIAAAGAGVVERIDEEWGYGKFVRIRHDLGYETTYAHIAEVPRGLEVGQRVRQGQTIAFIGSTGLSTGPHLYYEVRVNGRNVDPLKVRLAAGRVLSGAALDGFVAQRQGVEALLGAGRVGVSPH